MNITNSYSLEVPQHSMSQHDAEILSSAGNLTIWINQLQFTNGLFDCNSLNVPAVQTDNQAELSGSNHGDRLGAETTSQRTVERCG